MGFLRFNQKIGSKTSFHNAKFKNVATKKISFLLFLTVFEIKIQKYECITVKLQHAANRYLYFVYRNKFRFNGNYLQDCFFLNKIITYKVSIIR